NSLRVHLDAPPTTLTGLLRACVKSAYDSAVYEVRLEAASPQEVQAAQKEGFKDLPGRPLVRYLGSRGLHNETLPEEPGSVA
ncbi:MAG TPA: DUF1999 family protein, partial [Deinococcales bacterium]|nr:DUF1999 family protein [Deinococcales bacterium]